MKSFTYISKHHFSSFRQKCKSILLENDGLTKAQMIINLNKEVVSNKEESSKKFFLNDEKDNESWKELEFGFPKSLKFESPRKITQFLSGTS